MPVIRILPSGCTSIAWPVVLYHGCDGSTLIPANPFVPKLASIWPVGVRRATAKPLLGSCRLPPTRMSPLARTRSLGCDRRPLGGEGQLAAVEVGHDRLAVADLALQ